MSIPWPYYDVRLGAKREENEKKARRLAERFADLKKAADAANEAKEKSWERAKEAGTTADRCTTLPARCSSDLSPRTIAVPQ